MPRDKSELTLQIQIDLHLHTDHSEDSIVSVDQAITGCRARGLQGFAVTDHDTITGITEALEKSDDMIVIPGVEISSRGAHILGLDVQESVPEGLSMCETVDKLHEQGAIAILAHPYSSMISQVNVTEVKESRFDALEVANSTQFPYSWMLKKNIDLAKRLSLPQTGGSDAHIPQTVGRAYTVIESKSLEVEDLISSIKKGQIEARGRGVTFIERIEKLIKTL